MDFKWTNSEIGKEYISWLDKIIYTSLPNLKQEPIFYTNSSYENMSKVQEQ